MIARPTPVRVLKKIILTARLKRPALPTKVAQGMRRVAWLAKCLQSAEIRALRVKRSSGADASGAQMCIVPVRFGDAFDMKENVGNQLLF